MVTVRCNADDGLSLRLRDEIQHAFRRSRDFKLTDTAGDGILLVSIPSNVDWTESKGKTTAHYVLNLQDDHTTAKLTGVCRENELSKCGSAIVKDVRATIATWKR